MENILNNPFIDDAIILTKKDFGEGHLTITCLTKDHGLVRAFAFGGKRLSKRFKSSLEYFKVMEMEFVPKQNNNELIFTLSAVKSTKDTYKTLSMDMNKFIIACYVQELTSKILNPLEHSGKSGNFFFNTVTETLRKIDASPNGQLDGLIGFAYDLCVFMFHETGFIPDIETMKTPQRQLNHMEELHSSILGSSPNSFLMLTELLSSSCQVQGNSARNR